VIRDIVVYPDKTLRLVSKEVELFDDALSTLLDDMYDTMIDSNGVGLAAVQVGVLQRVLIIHIPREDDERHEEDLIEAVNPKIIDIQGEQLYQEGCLSVPEVFFDVKRAEFVEVEYFSRDGTKYNQKVDGFLAIAWQHEMEHLDGKVFIDHLSMLKRKKFEKEWRKQ
jgi:peptide deformylase